MRHGDFDNGGDFFFCEMFCCENADVVDTQIPNYILLDSEEFRSVNQRKEDTLTPVVGAQRCRDEGRRTAGSSLLLALRAARSDLLEALAGNSNNLNLHN
jgi:hypothetical protein